MDISVLYVLMKTLITKIEAVVIYEMCTRDRPEGIWDFSFMI